MKTLRKLFKTFIPFALILVGILLFAIIGHFVIEEDTPEPIQIVKVK
jgi:hypothetical protein